MYLSHRHLKYKTYYNVNVLNIYALKNFAYTHTFSDKIWQKPSP